MWTDKERIIAKSLIDIDTMAFLKKLFVDVVPSITERLDANIIALDDAEYGRLMKIKFLSGKENEARIALIKNIAKDPSDKPKVPIAPK